MAIRRLWCVATASAQEIATGDLERLLLSAVDPAIKFVLVLRGVDDIDVERMQRYPMVVSVILVEAAPLSVARNHGLAALAGLKPEARDFVCFPDDDAMFWPDTIVRLNSACSNIRVDFVGGSYGETQRAPKEVVGAMTAAHALVALSSITLFLQWSLVQQVGPFNERLGAGVVAAPYGEDNDYAIRAWRASLHPVRDSRVRMRHVECRPLLGRNPKGYLTIVALNLDLAAARRLLVRGFTGALLSDLRSRGGTSWPSVQHACKAVSRRLLKEVRGGVPVAAWTRFADSADNHISSTG